MPARSVRIASPTRKHYARAVMPEPAAMLEIRPAVRADLDALEALESRSFSSDRLSRRQLTRHLHSASACLLVAERPSAVLGDALVFFRRNSRGARLYSLAVDAAARGQGVGRALLAACEAAARARGAQAMRLEVRADNAAARALYEAAGYRLRDLRPGYYEDGMDARRYVKPL